MTYGEETLAKDLITEVRALRKACENRESDTEIQDRVNISLQRYEEMKAEIAELKRKNEELKERADTIELLLSKLDIPFESLKIDPESVMCEESVDITSFNKTRYVIVFNAEKTGTWR